MSSNKLASSFAVGHHVDIVDGVGPVWNLCEAKGDRQGESQREERGQAEAHVRNSQAASRNARIICCDVYVPLGRLPRCHRC